MVALAQISKAGTDQYSEQAWLQNRFYHLRNSGGQTFYYDSVTEDTTLTHQHLNYQLIKRGNSLESAKEIIKHTHFLPIVLKAEYVPGGDAVVSLEGNLYPNLWRPGNHPPKPIDSSPFTDHLAMMLGSKSKADYLVTALAYRYQQGYISSKPHIAFYFYGHICGYGKSLFATTIEQVFGGSAVRTVTDETALGSMSAIDVWTRTWAIVQEVDVKRGSTNYNQIKTMTGGNEFSAARKGEHFRKHRTPAQLIMLSNDAPHFLEANDRRFFVSKWQCEFGDDTEKNCYFNYYVNWLENLDGYSAIANLLNTTDISDFDLAAPAMMTEEKQAVLSMAEDKAVGDILDTLEASPDKLLWAEQDFRIVWSDHDTDPKAIKYKLE